MVFGLAGARAGAGDDGGSGRRACVLLPRHHGPVVAVETVMVVVAVVVKEGKSCNERKNAAWLPIHYVPLPAKLTPCIFS